MRRQDWPERLAAFVEANRDRPFAWGTWDCAMCASAWIETLTGAAPFAPTYTDALSAARFVAQQGGMGPAASAVLGAPLLFPMGAQRGDIALVVIDGRECLGVVLGERVAGPGEHGMIQVPRSDIIAAWTV